MIKNLNHITLAVKNIHRSFQFYRDIMGFKPLCLWDKGAYFLVNDLWLCLNVDDAREPNPCYTHYAFTVEPENFAQVSERLILSGVSLFKTNTSPGESLYFLDPDGHKLEIHVGNWQERINVKKNDLGAWKDVEWFV